MRMCAFQSCDLEPLLKAALVISGHAPRLGISVPEVVLGAHGFKVVERVRHALGQAEILLVAIGRSWLGRPGSRSPLERPIDPVRIAIEKAKIIVRLVIGIRGQIAGLTEQMPLGTPPDHALGVDLEAELAARMDVDQAYISRLEAGQKNPTITTLQLVSESLGIPIQELLEKT